MAFVDILAPYFADFGEAVTVQGTAARGIFDAFTADELGAVVGTQYSLDVAATVAAAEGGTVVVRGDNYRIRQVLDQPPDGQLRTLVLVKL